MTLCIRVIGSSGVCMQYTCDITDDVDLDWHFSVAPSVNVESVCHLNRVLCAQSRVQHGHLVPAGCRPPTLLQYLTPLNAIRAQGESSTNADGVCGNPGRVHASSTSVFLQGLGYVKTSHVGHAPASHHLAEEGLVPARSVEGEISVDG